MPDGEEGGPDCERPRREGGGGPDGEGCKPDGELKRPDGGRGPDGREGRLGCRGGRPDRRRKPAVGVRGGACQLEKYLGCFATRKLSSVPKDTLSLALRLTVALLPRDGKKPFLAPLAAIHGMAPILTVGTDLFALVPKMDVSDYK